MSRCSRRWRCWASGASRVVTVPVDGQGRMRAEALPALDARTIVCLQAGNVNTGAFDPAEAVCAAARAAGAWVHVDGAFGLWAAAAPARAHLAAGLGEADSWATDAHKWLNVPYDSGLAFVREPRHLAAAMAPSAAAYLAVGESREPTYVHARVVAPGARRRGLGGAAVAGPRGRGGSGGAHLPPRARFAEGLREAGYEVLNEVTLNQVLVALRRRRGHPRGDRRGAGGGHLLVRRHRVAGPGGDAHQRLLLGHDRGRCGAQPGRDHRHCPRGGGTGHPLTRGAVV